MTDFKSYIMSQGQERMQRRSPKFQPRPIQSTQPAASTTEAKAIRQEAAARSHNVFRPDIYRVSEGYLN